MIDWRVDGPVIGLRMPPEMGEERVLAVIRDARSSFFMKVHSAVGLSEQRNYIDLRRFAKAAAGPWPWRFLQFRPARAENPAFIFGWEQEEACW